MERTIRRALVGTMALILAASLAFGASGSAAVEAAPGASTLTILSGTVWVRHADVWAMAADGSVLVAGDSVRTAEDSRAVLTLFEGSTVEIEPASEISIDELAARDAGVTTVRLTQAVGRTWHVVTHLLQGGSRYEVRTPSATASVRGTAFEVLVTGEGAALTTVTTSEGKVATTDVAGGSEVMVTPDLMTSVRSGSAPESPSAVRAPERVVTVRLEAENSLVVDPLGRANGVKDGKVVSQTPGSRVAMLGGEVQVTLPNMQDGRIAVTVEPKFDQTEQADQTGRTGRSVAVTTTVTERGSAPVVLREQVQAAPAGGGKSGVDVKKNAGATEVRPVTSNELKNLRGPKVSSSARPGRTPEQVGAPGTTTNARLTAAAQTTGAADSSQADGETSNADKSNADKSKAKTAAESSDLKSCAKNAGRNSSNETVGASCGALIAPAAAINSSSGSKKNGRKHPAHSALPMPASGTERHARRRSSVARRDEASAGV